MSLPIHAIMRRIERLPLAAQVDELKAVIAEEKPYSIRRKELERLQVDVRRRQIKRELGPKRKRSPTVG
jgi:hypothetical protein